jgi:predicted AAA+ superfamily ATPase
LLLYKVPFFNTTGKRILKTSGKYYAVDSGIKNAELKFKIVNIGSLIENLVYIELLRRGYDVVIGRLYDGREIDFIAMKFNEIIYIQVTEHIFDDEKLMQREIGNLRTIKDNRKKIVLSLYDISHETEDGIEILNLID